MEEETNPLNDLIDYDRLDLENFSEYHRDLFWSAMADLEQASINGSEAMDQMAAEYQEGILSEAPRQYDEVVKHVCEMKAGIAYLETLLEFVEPESDLAFNDLIITRQDD